MASTNNNSNLSTGKKAAAAAAVGAAAVAAGVAFMKKGGKQTRFEVRPSGDGWGIFKSGNAKPEAVFEVKDEAIGEARQMANDNMPSQLAIHRLDGTLQDTHNYAAE